MKWVELLYIIAVNLPKLIEMIQRAKLEKKVTDDMQEIKKAFKDRDADALNRVFKP